MTGTIKKVTGTATLTVIEADLSATQTVSTASPYYYAPVTFTTTVTNTSATTTATGVTAAVAVNEPAGLVSPAAASTGSYAGGTDAIGSLAPGRDRHPDHHRRRRGRQRRHPDRDRDRQRRHLRPEPGQQHRLGEPSLLACAH